MTRLTARQAIRGATVAVHLTVAGALVLMTIPSYGNVVAQLRSGYAPPNYWLYPVLVLVASVLAASVALGLIRWWQGIRRTLIAIDAVVLAASWTILSVFVFSTGWPIVVWVLSPVALVLTWRAPTVAQAGDINER